ncbi:MAG: Ornithine carbamoyltransferase [Actinomycetota bacterium]
MNSEKQIDVRGRHFLKEIDFSKAELLAFLDLAARLKMAGRHRHQYLKNLNLALIFEKTSTRTRAAFEVAAFHQGAHVTYIDPTASQIGHKESIADTARVLSRFYDGIQFRGNSQNDVEVLAENSKVPVFNGLTDEWHPTQMLADFLTMFEHARTNNPSDISYAYVGDARNNMGNSLLITGAILGADVRIAAPKELQPNLNVQKLAQELAASSGAKITITDDAGAAVKGAEFIHTDVWVSMGEPAEVWQQRIDSLKPFQVNHDLLEASGRSDTKFMHCLPAYHDVNTKIGAEIATKFGLNNGIEVTSEVFDSVSNIAFDQAENRLHTIEAVLVGILAEAAIADIQVS